MIKKENMAFWILIALVVCIAVWKLIGSPTDTSALVSVSLFVVGSEILLWRALFLMDKKDACGFIKIKHEIKDMKIKPKFKLKIIGVY